MMWLVACGGEATTEAEVKHTPPPMSTTERTGPAPIPIPSEPPKAPRRCPKGPEMAAPEGCVSGVLKCGDKVTGTTEGGTQRVGNDRYASGFCFPATTGNHDAPERGYRFEAPAYKDVVIELTSPCVDLDLTAMAWDWDGGCPGEDDLVSECEGSTRSGGDKVRLQVFNPREYFVLVDGKNGDVGPYSLTVSCRDLRRPGEK